MVSTPILAKIPPMPKTHDIVLDNIKSGIGLTPILIDEIECATIPMTTIIPTLRKDYVVTGAIERPRYHKHSACPHCGAPVDVSRQSCEYCECVYEME